MTDLGNGNAPDATAQNQAERQSNYRDLESTNSTWREDSSIPSERLTLEPHEKPLCRNASTPSSKIEHEHFPHTARHPELLTDSMDSAPSRPMMRLPHCQDFNLETRRLLNQAPRYPPVTKKTLSELDLGWIMNNINLRCDVNYDNDLHFMPVKGKRGDDKRRDAKAYWAALATELQVYQLLSNANESATIERNDCDNFAQRLPDMFASLRELLEVLIPHRDHLSVAEHLDVDFLMQQIVKGVLDIAGLARWLAELLKQFCAPMRDALADDMSALIERGLQQQNMRQITDGLEKLFAVLEAMKLDVANHQIRTFRLVLIDDTEQFQRDFFRRRIQEGKFDPSGAQRWYHDSLRSFEQSAMPQILSFTNVDTRSSRGIQPLLYSLVCDLTAPLPPLGYPSTFSYDGGRLARLRDDLQELIYVRVCFSLLNQLVAELSHGRFLSAPPPVYTTLQLRIFAILDSSGRCSADDVTRVWGMNLYSIALEILSAASSTFHGYHGWNDLNTTRNFPDQDVKHTYHRLVSLIRDSLIHEHLTFQARAEIMYCTLRHINRFTGMGARAISDEQQNWISQRNSSMANRINHPEVLPLQPNMSLPDIEDIARRLAHMLVLNWRVWADLCYLNDFESSTESDVQGQDISLQAALNHHERLEEGSGEDWDSTIVLIEPVNAD